MIIYIFLLLLVSLVLYKGNISVNGVFYPPVFLSLLVVLGFLIPYPILLSLKYENPFFIFWPYKFNNFEESLNLGLLAAFIGLISFIIGFYFWDRKKTIFIKKNNNNKYHKTFLYIFIFLIYTVCIG